MAVPAPFQIQFGGYRTLKSTDVMALKHLTRITLPRDNGAREEVFVNDAGFEVDALARFRRHLVARGNQPTTIKRYVEAAARFVDFLIECRVFGYPATPGAISDAMNAYPVFLRRGAAMSWPDLPSLDGYARDIGFSAGLADRSATPVVAAVNHFLALARDEALKGMTVLRDADLQADWLDLSVTFAAIDGTQRWSQHQRERLKQQTLIGGVVRVRDRLERPLGLRSPFKGRKQIDLENKDFPLDRLADLLGSARSHRDRALWALLAGGGLRLHEALNLRLGDLDARNGEVWVIDPNNARFGREMTPDETLRFKGRTMSRVYFYEPLGSIFREALRSYLATEFVGGTDPRNDFLFRKLDGADRGAPLVHASDTAHQKQFKKAVIAASVPGPEEAPEYAWTLHSLRHSYGVYMLNYLPVPGGPGLRLTEVQTLMGHASPESTQIYARHATHLLQARVAAANEFVYSGLVADSETALREMPFSIASRLRETADRLERNATARQETSTSNTAAIVASAQRRNGREA